MKRNLLIHFIFFFITLFSVGIINAQEESSPVMSKSNRRCVKCHGNKYYTLDNTVTGQLERKRMNPYFVIDTMKYMKGVHHEFSCDDCHSPDYATYPHAAELKLEPKFSCLDCHGGDESFAKFHFEEIETEVEASVHRKAFGENFKCEMCHDIHTFQLVARNENSKITDIVKKDNDMCLSCHNDLSKYQILTDNKKPELLSTHSWLPNQALHFLNVRCIECHTPVEDTMMVSHLILPKEQAVRNCAKCHSTNSLLRDKLYKYAARQARTDKGFYNSVILNEAYVIGANRNRYFNIISIIIFAMTLGGIGIHTLIRIIKKK